MDRLKQYRERKAKAEVNYITKLNETKRLAGEAYREYEEKLADILREYKATPQQKEGNEK